MTDFPSDPPGANPARPDGHEQSDGQATFGALFRFVTIRTRGLGFDVICLPYPTFPQKARNLDISVFMGAEGGSSAPARLRLHDAAEIARLRSAFAALRQGEVVGRAHFVETRSGARDQGARATRRTPPRLPLS